MDSSQEEETMKARGEHSPTHAVDIEVLGEGSLAICDWRLRPVVRTSPAHWYRYVRYIFDEGLVRAFNGHLCTNNIGHHHLLLGGNNTTSLKKTKERSIRVLLREAVVLVLILTKQYQPVIVT